MELTDDMLETNLAVANKLLSISNSFNVVSRETEISEIPFCFEILYTK